MKRIPKALILILSIVGLCACGVKNNSGRNRPFVESEISFLTIERKCSTSKVDMEPTSLEIATYFYEYQRTNPKAFIFIPARNYDYKTPLIINAQAMKEKLADIKARVADLEYMSAHTIELESELYYLHQNAMRFEGSKCSFSSLIQKQFNDLRPFLNLNDFCREKTGSDLCAENLFKLITKNEAQLVEESTVSMCRSFDSSDVNCQAQFSVQKRDKTKLHSLVTHYQKRFKNERFSSLFKLRNNHLTFSCQKENEATIMNLKVSSINHDIMALQELLDYVQETWRRSNFKLKIEQVESKGSDVIEIIPSSGMISYVPDNNNRQIYLSTNLDLATKKKVLAHEFGHVLGFPDCYIEFFDNQKKDLIYYEMGKEDTNIMCSMKEGVRVLDDYFDQLTENSCVFN